MTRPCVLVILRKPPCRLNSSRTKTSNQIQNQKANPTEELRPAPELGCWSTSASPRTPSSTPASRPRPLDEQRRRGLQDQRRRGLQESRAPPPAAPHLKQLRRLPSPLSARH